MQEKLVKMVLEECKRRSKYYYKKADVEDGYRAENIYAASSYDSVVAMLEYALARDYECLGQFMTEEPE